MASLRLNGQERYELMQGQDGVIKLDTTFNHPAHSPGTEYVVMRVREGETAMRFSDEGKRDVAHTND